MATSDDDWETVSESSEPEMPGEEEPNLNPPYCPNCEVYNWDQKEDPANLLPCSGCSMISYCSEDCRKEHWVKVHRHHCTALAGPGDTGETLQLHACMQEGGCGCCGGTGHQVEDCPACSDDNPTYPSLEARMLRAMKTLPPCLSSHHPFPLAGLPGDRTERIVIVLQKLLLKMVLTKHEVTEKCSKELDDLQQIMFENRTAIWFNRKTKPSPEFNEVVIASINPGDDEVDVIKRKTGRLYHEYTLSDDHFRLWDLFMIVHTILDYTTGPLACQRDFKDALAMVPDSLRPLVEQAQASTYLEVVDKVLDALEPQVVPYIDIVKIICGGSLEKQCSVCGRQVTVAEVSQIKKRIGRVATWFNTINMGVIRCERMSCLDRFNQLPSRVGYQEWWAGITASKIKFQENTCDFCFKMSHHKDVHRCKQCLTKIYCGKECQLGDWEIVHKLVCKGKGLKRKRKEGARERKEQGEQGAQSMLEFGKIVAFKSYVADSGDFEGYVNYTRMLGELGEALEEV